MKKSARVLIFSAISVTELLLSPSSAYAEGIKPVARERSRQEDAKRQENQRKDERKAPEMKAAERNAPQSFYQKPPADAPKSSAELRKAIETEQNNSGRTLAKSGVTTSPAGEVASPTVPTTKPKSETGEPARGRLPGP